MVLKNIRVFVYSFNVPNNYYQPSILKNIFSTANITSNIESYGDDALLLIIDEEADGFLYGRFLVLRKDIPSILNKQTTEEREITLSSDENIKEESHFLINLQDKFLFGEYNYHSIRHFSHPLIYYLKKRISGSPIDIKPSPNPETLALLKRDRELKSFEFSINQERLSHQEQTGIPLLGSLIGLSSNNENSIKIIVSRGRKKENKLDSDTIIEKLENLKNTRGEDLYSLKVETEKSKYDLLNGNLISFELGVNQINKRTNKVDFYRKIKPLYNQEISSIKELLRSP